MNPSTNVEKILIQRGVLSAEALEQAVRLKERQGGSLAVNLVITGAVDDETLSSFYRERYRLEPLGEDEIASVDGQVFRMIPVEIIYDFGLFPVRLEGEEGMERLVVGMIDPSEPDVLEEASFFAALELVPKLMTIGQMARHYARLTGKRWKVDWETVVARRRIYQAKLQADSEDVEDPISADAPIELTNPVMELLDQTEALDHSLNHLFDAPDGEEEAPRSELVIALVSIDENNLEEEEVIELTRVKNRAVSAMPGKLAMEEAARPRVKRKGRGENRWILDPAEEGEVRIKGAPVAAPPKPEELPKIIVDTALLSPEEAEARVAALEQALISPRKKPKTTPLPAAKKTRKEIEPDWLETVEGKDAVQSEDPVASPKTLPLGSPDTAAKAPSPDTTDAKPAPTPTQEPEATVPEVSVDDGWPEPEETLSQAGPAAESESADPDPVDEAPRSSIGQGLTFQLDAIDEVPDSEQGFAQALDAARERDEAGIAVAAYLRETYDRVVLWSMRGQQVSAWIVHAGSEPNLTPDRTPLELTDLDCLSRATGGNSYLGPVGAENNRAQAHLEVILGGEMPMSAVAIPIHIGDRQIGMIYCDNGNGEAVTLDKERLSLVQSLLANSLRRVILLRKRRRRH